MGVQIRKAKRSATKLRLLVSGPSGSGKTWGALTIAKGLGGKTAVIDTEEGSSDIYDHLHEFDVVDMKPPFTPERYIEAIEALEQAGYEIIIIDSITHEWSGKGGCLELVDEIARAQFRGNTWSAYSVITPRHRAFIDAMLRSSAHIIATGRSKTETAQVDDGGRKKVAKLGMKVETRDGVEYEFTTVLDIIHDGHFATASKDRTGIFAGKDPKPITVATGKMLAAWLDGGPPAPVASAPTPAKTAAASGTGAGAPAEEPSLFHQIADYIAGAKAVKTLGKIADRIDELISDGQLTTSQAHDLNEELKKRHDVIEPEATANGVA
jgi:hypothetical protein